MQSLSELHASPVFEAATSPSRAEASGPAGGPAACRAALRPRPRPFLDVIYDAQHHHIAEIHRPALSTGPDGSASVPFEQACC